MIKEEKENHCIASFSREDIINAVNSHFGLNIPVQRVQENSAAGTLKVSYGKSPEFMFNNVAYVLDICWRK